jgi:hypothetical protein
MHFRITYHDDHDEWVRTVSKGRITIEMWDGKEYVPHVVAVCDPGAPEWEIDPVVSAWDTEAIPRCDLDPIINVYGTYKEA